MLIQSILRKNDPEYRRGEDKSQVFQKDKFRSQCRGYSVRIKNDIRTPEHDYDKSCLCCKKESFQK